MCAGSWRRRVNVTRLVLPFVICVTTDLWLRVGIARAHRVMPTCHAITRRVHSRLKHHEGGTIRVRSSADTRHSIA
jgi:hypothetical protein